MKTIFIILSILYISNFAQGKLTILDCPSERAEMCEQSYEPVCGYVQLFKDWENFPNRCVACMNSNIQNFIEGECKLENMNIHIVEGKAKDLTLSQEINIQESEEVEDTLLEKESYLDQDWKSWIECNLNDKRSKFCSSQYALTCALNKQGEQIYFSNQCNACKYTDVTHYRLGECDLPEHYEEEQNEKEQEQLNKEFEDLEIQSEDIEESEQQNLDDINSLQDIENLDIVSNEFLIEKGLVIKCEQNKVKECSKSYSPVCGLNGDSRSEYHNSCMACLEGVQYYLDQFC